MDKYIKLLEKMKEETERTQKKLDILIEFLQTLPTCKLSDHIINYNRVSDMFEARYTGDAGFVGGSPNALYSDPLVELFFKTFVAGYQSRIEEEEKEKESSREKGLA